MSVVASHSLSTAHELRRFLLRPRTLWRIDEQPVGLNDMEEEESYVNDTPSACSNVLKSSRELGINVGKGFLPRDISLIGRMPDTYAPKRQLA